MPISNRSQLSDLRGVTRMAVDATDSIVETVEKMHRTVQLRPGLLGAPVADRPSGITGLVYRSVRGGVRLVGRAIGASLAGWAAGELIESGDHCCQEHRVDVARPRRNEWLDRVRVRGHEDAGEL